MSEWISTKEHLPKEQQRVLFVVASGEYAGEVFGGKYVDDSWGFSIPGIGFGSTPTWVTYWMPLPEPPKAESAGGK